MDLYDTSSFQSLAGLEAALELGARYGVPQTLFVSTRLTFDQAAAREWADHYGVDRGAAEIPRFIDWLRAQVEWRHVSPYPATSNRPYVMELGNHGHLHYDTDAAGAPGNGWKAGARPGEGRYPWVGNPLSLTLSPMNGGEGTESLPSSTNGGEGTEGRSSPIHGGEGTESLPSSFGEQRDNILEARRWCERLFGFTPRSWAKPGRGNDAHTARAVAAAGCEVATGSDIRARDNVLRQPPPHHPADTRIVELTARYPSDPQHIYHAAMLVFWMHRAHRRRIPMVYLGHQHLRQFAGTACARFTEYLLRYALERFQGDLYVDTVYGLGAYWRDALSEATAVVRITREGGRITVTNGSDRDLAGLPIDIALAGGQRLTRLVSLPAGESRRIEF